MTNNHIHHQTAQGNASDEAADNILASIADASTSRALEELINIAPQAARYLRTMQEYAWTDDEMVRLAGRKFLVEARRISTLLKVLGEPAK